MPQCKTITVEPSQDDGDGGDGGGGTGPINSNTAALAVIGIGGFYLLRDGIDF